MHKIHTSWKLELNDSSLWKYGIVQQYNAILEKNHIDYQTSEHWAKSSVQQLQGINSFKNNTTLQRL